MSAQRLSRKRRSLRSSSSLAPAAAVRTMKPPEASPFSLSRISFRRRRSPSDSILRETPVWLTVGMKTRKRPGSAMCEVMRAPFLAMGSLAIWTRISWPGLSRSLMAGRLVDCMELRPRRSRPPLRSRSPAPPVWRERSRGHGHRRRPSRRPSRRPCGHGRASRSLRAERRCLVEPCRNDGSRLRRTLRG